MRARVTGLHLIAAAAALAGLRVFAQERAEPAGDSFDSVAEQIEGIQSAQGVNSPGLIDPLTSLGLILREQGDLGPAVATFERARHLVRVNYGLSSFEEAPLLRQLLQIEEGKGNHSAAWDLEQELLGLIHRYPGPRAAPMLKEIADKRADVLRRYSAGEFPPQIMLGCYYAGRSRDPDGNCPRSGSRFVVQVTLLDEARSYYMDTISMVLQSEGPSAAELPELYSGWVRAIYTFPDDEIAGYEGREILRDIHSLAVRNEQPLAVQMDALLEIADWDLLFARGREKNEAALGAYEILYEQLRLQGLEQSAIDEMFSPSVPVVLPTFRPNPLASTDAGGASGYVDVAFDITKYGEGESIEFLDTSTNKTEAARVEVRDHIKWSRFRPRATNGAFEDPARVVVRYYVDDQL